MPAGYGNGVEMRTHKILVMHPSLQLTLCSLGWTETQTALLPGSLGPEKWAAWGTRRTLNRSFLWRHLHLLARYSGDHNNEIESAFRNGVRLSAFLMLCISQSQACALHDRNPKAVQADIVIGIRSYEVLFEGSTMHGKQALNLVLMDFEVCIAVS